MGVKLRASALAIGFGALLAGTTPTGGFAAGEAAEAKAKPDKNDPSRRVCRNLLPTGSRLTTRVCRTQEEWDKSAEKAGESHLRHQLNESTQLEQAAGPMGVPAPR